MTVDRRDKEGTPFGRWLREHKDLDSLKYSLSITDADFWVHRFTPRKGRKKQESDVRRIVEHIMMVEVKCFLKDKPFAQDDTLKCINYLCRLSTTRKDGRRITRRMPEDRPGLKGHRRLRFMGVHLLQLSGDRPDNSDRVIWDQKHDLSESALVEVLRFDRDPDSPGKILDTRIHHRDRTLTLFEHRERADHSLNGGSP